MSTQLPSSLHFDVLIVGSGLAGLSAALLLSQQYRVAILTKRAVREGSSGWAQGGIAAVTRPEDSFASHVADTIKAGGGLCDPAAVELLHELQATGELLPATADNVCSLAAEAYERQMAHILTGTTPTVDEMRRVIVHHAPYAILVLNRSGVETLFNVAPEAVADDVAAAENADQLVIAAASLLALRPRSGACRPSSVRRS